MASASAAAVRMFAASLINMLLYVPLSVAVMTQSLRKRKPVDPSDVQAISCSSWFTGLLTFIAFIVLPTVGQLRGVAALNFLFWAIVAACLLCTVAYVHLTPPVFSPTSRPLRHGTFLCLPFKTRFHWGNWRDVVMLLGTALEPYAMFALGTTDFGGLCRAVALGSCPAAPDANSVAAVMPVVGLGALWFDGAAYAGFGVAASFAFSYALLIGLYQGSISIPEKPLEFLPRALLPGPLLVPIVAQLTAASFDPRMSALVRAASAVAAGFIAVTAGFAASYARPAAAPLENVLYSPRYRVVLAAGKMVSTFICVACGAMGYVVAQGSVALAAILLQIGHSFMLTPRSHSVPFVAHLSAAMHWVAAVMVATAGIITPAWGLSTYVAWALVGVSLIAILLGMLLYLGDHALKAVRVAMADQAAAALEDPKVPEAEVPEAKVPEAKPIDANVIIPEIMS